MALALPGTKIDAGKIYTVFAEGTVTGPDGNKLQAVWAVVDPSAPPAGKARLRVAHASPNAGPGTIFLNDKVAFFGVAFGQITDYTTVDAGVVNVKVKPAQGDVLILDNDGSSSLDLPDYAPVYRPRWTSWASPMTCGMPTWRRVAIRRSPAPTGWRSTRRSSTRPATTSRGTAASRCRRHSPPWTWTGWWSTPTTAATIIAFGQDLASVTAGNTSSAPFFYSAVLGRGLPAGQRQRRGGLHRLRRSSSPACPARRSTTPASTSAPWATAPATRATWMRSRSSVALTRWAGLARTVSPQYRPLLKYSVGGNFVDQGYVALANRDPPTLERPGSDVQRQRDLLHLRPWKA